MNVYGLFASLGIDIDAASFAAADAALDKVRASAEHLQATMRENSAHFSQVVLDTARAARGNIEDAVVSWDGWQKKTREATDWTKHWARGVRAAVGVAVAAFAVQQTVTRVTALGDAYNGAVSRINQLVTATGDQVRVQEQLFQVAQDSGTAFSSVAALFQQVGKAAKDSGRSTEQAIAITDTLNKAIKAGGTSAQGAEAALQQLSQGLGSGVLRGEEFNSVMEQAPIIIDILAESMGKSRGEMRKLAEGGKLTSDVIFKALEGSKDKIDEAFAKRIPQVSEMFVRLKNEIERAFGQMLQDKEVMSALTDGIKAFGAALLIVIKGFAALVKFMARNQRLVVGALIAIASALTVVAGAAAAAWLAIYGPVALAVAALAVFYAYAEDIIVGMAAAIMFLGSKVLWVGRLFKKLGRTIHDALRDVVEFIASIGQTIINGIEGAIDWIADKLDWLIDKAKGLVNSVAGVAANPIGSARGAAKSALGISEDSVLSDAIDAVTDVARALPGLGWLGGGLPQLPPALLNKAAAGGMGPISANTTINVNAPHADPQAVAGIVQQEFDASWDRRMRDTFAASGGNE